MNLFTRLRYLALVLLAMSGLASNADPSLQIVEACLAAEEPETCLTDYGYRCHSNRRLAVSTSAFSLNCNLTLPNGQSHFAQLLFDGGTVSIETSKTSDFSEYKPTGPEVSASSTLTDHLRSSMEGYRNSGNGSTFLEDSSSVLEFNLGARRRGDQLEVRSLCGYLFDKELTQERSDAVRTGCEKILLDGIRRYTQYDANVPYSAPGPNQIEWSGSTLSLFPDTQTLLFDARILLPSTRYACRWIAGCCSMEGAHYLNSCRTPTDEELEVASSCLRKHSITSSEAYTVCLRDAGVKAGCEPLEDGSRLCY